MIIREIFVSAFGKLESERFVLSEGLNCRVEKNGYGKTTLLTFIKVMLYGIEDGKRSITENERKRYLPWRGGAASGYIIIEVGGNEYRIERSFGKRSSEDSFKVYDLKTGSLTDKFSERPGEDIFGIDKDGFERTVFLSEKLLSGKIENDTVSGKLGGLVGARYDIGEYESAVELLDESRKRYIKRGGSGEIAEIKSEIFECEGRLKELSDKRGIYSQNLSRIEAAKRELQRLGQEREELLKLKEKKDAHTRRGDEIRRFKAISEEISVKEARLLEIKKILGENPPSIDEVFKHRSALTESEVDTKIDAQLNQSSTTVFKRIPTEEEITFNIKALNEPKGSNKKGPGGIVMLMALLGIIFGAIAIFTTPFLYICAGACLLASLLLSLKNHIKCKSLYANSVKNCRNYLNSIYESPDFSRDLNSLLADALADLKNENARILLAEKSDGERRKKRLAFENAKAYFDSFGLTPTELTELINEHALLRMDIKARREMLGRTAPSEEPYLDTALAKINPDERIREVYESSAVCERERSRLTVENEKLAAELSSEEQVKDTLEGLRERLAFCEERVRILDLTKELMAKAKNDMTARYLDGTKRAFIKYTESLGETGEFTLDTSFDIKKYDGGATREREAYSKGSRELYSFALRLALIDTLYRDDKPPIIIDDAFMSLDDAHLSSAIKLLSTLGRERQIIYFTCTSARGIR